MASRMVVAVFSWPKKVTRWAVSCAKPLDEVAGLDEHAARAAGGIEDDAVVGFDDVDDGLDERGRGEELAVVLRALHGELHEEVFVDAPEDIAAGGAEHFAVEDAEDLFEEVALELVVVLGKLALQRLEVALDGVHRLDEGGAEVGPFGQLEQLVVAGLFWKHQRPAFQEVLLDQRPLRHLAGGLVVGDLPAGGVIAVCGVAQEDDAEDRHAVFAGGQLGIGPELVGGSPEAVFELFDVLKLILGHSTIPEKLITPRSYSSTLDWQSEFDPGKNF